ncbi:MAG: protocatechuate 3,4-dioxygenase subunit alpha [Oxalobacteraceae bacterium]
MSIDKPLRLGTTPSQTVGPYLHMGLDWLNTTELAGPAVAGERIVIQGRLLDADRAPMPDGVIEIWQANSQGRYAHPDDHRALPLDTGFTGFGRTPTGAHGEFRFSTIKPGRVPATNGQLQAPHIMVNVFARGLLRQAVTRIYFPEDDHASDPVMARVPVNRRMTLIAQAVAGQPGVLEWNVLLGGEQNETVFFDV